MSRNFPLLIAVLSSMALVLSLMKKTGNAAVWREKRVRFEHNATGNASAEDIEMIRDMGIVMAHTPKYGQAVAQLPNNKSELTMVNGKIVYQK